MIVFLNLSQRFVSYVLLRIFFYVFFWILMQIFSWENFSLCLRLIIIRNVVVLHYIFWKDIRFGNFINYFRALIFILSVRSNFVLWHKNGFKVELCRFDINLAHLQILIILILNIVACCYLLKILYTFDIFTRLRFGLVLPFIDFLNQINQPFQSLLNKFSLLKKLFNCYLGVNIEHLAS